MSHVQKQFFSLLYRAGFVLVRQKKHLVFRRPDGVTFTAPSTPSDVRAWRNQLAGLRRLLSRVNPDTRAIVKEAGE